MRRIGWMFLVVLGSAGLMYAQSSDNSMKLSGTVCQSTCVVSTSPGISTCDPLCTDKSDRVVLVDDQGNVRKIANQDMCKSHIGKHVKATAMSSDTNTPSSMAVPTEKQREQELRIMELHDDPGGG